MHIVKCIFVKESYFVCSQTELLRASCFTYVCWYVCLQNLNLSVTCIQYNVLCSYEMLRCIYSLDQALSAATSIALLVNLTLNL